MRVKCYLSPFAVGQRTITALGSYLSTAVLADVQRFTTFSLKSDFSGHIARQSIPYMYSYKLLTTVREYATFLLLENEKMLPFADIFTIR